MVSSSKQTSKNMLNTKAKSSKIVMDDTSTQKTAPSHKLKHSASNLKKIARLPVDDRKQVLKILMKKVHRRKRIKRSKTLNDAISKGSLVQSLLLQLQLIMTGRIGRYCGVRMKFSRGISIVLEGS